MKTGSVGDYKRLMRERDSTASGSLAGARNDGDRINTITTRSLPLAVL